MQCGFKNCEFFANGHKDGVPACSWHLAGQTLEGYQTECLERRKQKENQALELFNKSEYTKITVTRDMVEDGVLLFRALRDKNNNLMYTTCAELMAAGLDRTQLLKCCAHVLDYWNITAVNFGGLAACYFGHYGCIPNTWDQYKQALLHNQNQMP